MNRISRYYAGVDGTKLAVDVYLPEEAASGKDRVPVLMKAGYSPRRQAYQFEKESIDRFVADGYAVAIVEVRGAGASFGVSDGFFGLHDGKDLASVISQLAAEPWCNGKAGTYGGSNYGMSQEINLIEQPEVLKVSFPCDCSMDFYDQDFPNGASALPEMAGGPDPNRRAPENDSVDEDADGSMLREAEKAHERNLPFLAQHIKNMCRDDVHPYLGYRPNLDVPMWEKMDKVRFGHVQVTSLGAWFDPGVTNKIITWKWIGGKLMIGPWMHTGIYRPGAEFPEGDIDWVAVHEKEFAKYLKDESTAVDCKDQAAATDRADSCIRKEPPVRYYTVGERESSGRNPWKFDDDFPVSGQTFAKLYLSAGGALAESCPAQGGSVDYQVRNDIQYYTKFGRMNRNNKEDLRAEDAKSIVFTGEVLSADLELTGIPVMDLYVTSSHPDGNFFAVLEEVEADGTSHFLTEGVIRASHAKTHMNPAYMALGLPYHRGYREDMVSLSAEKPMKLSFHLEAISRIIKKGSRLQVSISCGGSGYQQPEGFPKDGEEMPWVRLYTGVECPSVITLPVVRPTVTTFTHTLLNGKTGTAILLRGGLYFKEGDYDPFELTDYDFYPARQVYPAGEGMMIWQLQNGVQIARITEGGKVCIHADADNLKLSGGDILPERAVIGTCSDEIPLPEMPWNRARKMREADKKNLYVATVPVSKGVEGNMNPMMRNFFDIYINIAYPTGVELTKLPCVINIHGFGGNHHQFESNTDLFLEKGFAVASVDYRLTPPEIWEAPCVDVHGCIRYLKAHSEELGLDPERFAVIGGSMGGYLTSMMAAVNGDPALEGDIGGNTGYDSRIKAAAAYFAPTDILHFGDDAALVWPSQPDKVANGDGGFAPPASMTGHIGYGKGMADLKAHLFDQDPKYVALREITRMASPISHVTENSAPLCLVHGIFDCGIQVPMGQSIRMFEAYTRKGVKSLLLCNNNGFFGEDPEVKRAVVEFIANRI